jgi:hypothetical protein
VSIWSICAPGSAAHLRAAHTGHKGPIRPIRCSGGGIQIPRGDPPRASRTLGHRLGGGLACEFAESLTTRAGGGRGFGAAGTSVNLVVIDFV